MSWIDVMLTAAGLPALAASSYLAALAVLARRQGLPRATAPRLKFDVVVPAHNEEIEIGATVASLLALGYPRTHFRVLVIADNCVDGTAAKAAAAGARVLVRDDLELRGKGHALAYAFSLSLAEGFADAVVVVDADTVVSKNLLSAFAARFEAGAEVLQAEYGVRNPLSSWRTRLMTIALSAFHGVRSLARERLRLSCGLRGNGMAFSSAILRRVPPSAFSIVEDLEYGLQLGRAGVRVQYAGEAKVLGQMVEGERASRSQRQRWESGRRAIVRQQGLPLLTEALRRRNLVLFDLLVDLLVPPVGELLAFIVVGAALCVFAGAGSVAPWIWGASFAGLLLYVLRGWSLSGVGLYGLVDLMWAPVYILWKLTLWFRHKGKRPLEWIRTTREVRM
jgi:cellulose synthase/poly-beta-1,6-N-acetylglucosamine synthase-like glycosyltransferase